MKKGLECTIDGAMFDRVIKPLHGTPCPVCKNLMLRLTRHAPALDRVDNSKGYTPDNVAIICWRCNTAKSNLTPLELQALADYARQPVTLDQSPLFLPV